MDEWARPDDIEVFATGDSELVDRDVEQGVVLDAVRRGGAAVRDLHARPGYRPGVTPHTIATSSGRRSGPTDVVHPVLVDPRRAADVAVDELFRDPIDGLTIEDEHPDQRRRFLVWQGRLSGGGHRPVGVSIHLLASPSMVVTVLELVPHERLRWHRRAFVRDGVRVIGVLADRLRHLSTGQSVDWTLAGREAERAAC